MRNSEARNILEDRGEEEYPREIKEWKERLARTKTDCERRQG